MVIRIPQNGKFSQPNKGDIFGNLKGTLNVDLITNPGRLKLSPRMTVITKDNDTDITNFGLPIGFSTHVISGGTEVVVCATGAGSSGATGTGKVFANAAVGFGAFTAVGSSPSTIHGMYSDMVSASLKETNAYKRLYFSTFGASGSPDISQLDGSTWNNTWFSSTRSGSGLVNAAPVHLCPAFNGNLYIAQEFQIMYAPNTGNIVKPSSTTDANTTQGTIHTLGKYIITWMRSSSNRLWVGLIEANTTTSSRQGGYVGVWDGAGTAFNAIYKINAPMAMSCVIRDDIPYIIDGFGIIQRFNGTGFIEVARLPVANTNYEMPGVYSPYSNLRWIHPRGMDVVNRKIRVNVNNYVSSGVYVNEMPSGVWEFDPDNASQGVHHVNSPCADSNDYGQQFVEGAGAIFPLKTSAGNFMAGVSYYTDNASTNRKAIFFDDIASGTDKRGTFTLPFVSSSAIKDIFQKLFYRTSLLASGDKIIPKHRTTKNVNFPALAGITWTSTTTFTSTDADFANVSGGEEIEVVMGKRASTTAHVSSISYSNPTYTITLDDAIGSASGSAMVRIDNFKRIGQGLTGTDAEQGVSIDTGTATKIQIKTELRFSGNAEVDDLTITNKTDQKAE